MFTPAIRFLLIAATIAAGILLFGEKPYPAFLLFLSAALFLIGYFRAGTVWLAFRAFRKGRIEAAGALLDQIPGPEWLNPQFKAYYHWIRGAEQLQGGHPEPALRHLELALAGALKTTNARSGVGLTMVQAWIELDELDQAEAALVAARELPHQQSMDLHFDRFESRLWQLRNPDLRQTVRIEGDAVHLRDPVPEDIEAMVRWWTTDVAWTEWDAPWEPIDGNEERVRASWVRQLARPPDLPRCRLMIVLPDDTPVGRVNLYRIDGDFGRIALGINLHESALWGRGLGREAFSLWADYVFREHEKDRLYCETWSGNERMLRVAGRLGFVEVARRPNIRKVRGKRHDALRLAVDREDFRRSVAELGILLPE